MAIRSVNSLSHYTDWTIGPVDACARLGGDNYIRVDLCLGAVALENRGLTKFRIVLSTGDAEKSNRLQPGATG